MTTAHKTTIALVGVSLLSLAGCASKPDHTQYMPAQGVYDSAYSEGARDSIDVLREGLRSRQVYGVTDPYIPLRTPDEVIPVWVPDYVDASGRRVSGHWQHTVVRRSQWYTE